MSIVLGYDESPGAASALQTAIELAVRFGEPLVLVHGFEPPGGAGEESRVHREALAERGRAVLAFAVGAASSAGLETVVELVPAKAAEALVDMSERHDARLIVVGPGARARCAVRSSAPPRTSCCTCRGARCSACPPPTDPSPFVEWRVQGLDTAVSAPHRATERAGG